MTKPKKALHLTTLQLYFTAAGEFGRQAFVTNL